MTKAFWSLTVTVLVCTGIIYQYLPTKQPHAAYWHLLAENHTLVDPPPMLVNYTFKFEEPDFCNRNPDLRVIAYIHSAIDRTEKRRITRETWARAGRYDDKVKVGVVFMVGLPKNSEEEEILKEESRLYRDIVQGNYTDTYHTLSFKALASLNWVSRHCAHVPWTLHADDDVLVDLFLLIGFLKVVETNDTFLCHTWKNSPVRREGRWFVHPRDFKRKKYPPYCSGAVWILATGLIQRLLNAARHSPFLWVDDVYATGILANSAGIGHSNYFKSFISKDSIKEIDFGKIIAWVHILDRDQWWQKILSHYKYIK